tara:strand:+ start:1714 stop:3978 length:2265 start_codon:yes stop_codon:yes gene_type:complete
MSFGNVDTEVELSNRESYFVVGENKDIGDEGTSRNGVGKTTIIQAIVYALYGKGIEPKLNADDYINMVNEKKLVVSLDFNVNGTGYRVTRKRKPNAVELEELDSEGNVAKSLTRDSMGNTDKAIVDIIGIPHNIFVGVYFMSPHHDAFMKMSVPDQRNFIESALSLDILTERAETLKKIRSDIKTDIKLQEKDVENAKDNNERVSDNIEAIKLKIKNWELEYQKQTKELEDIIEEGNTIDFDAQFAIFDKIDKLKESLHKIPETDTLERDIRDNDREKNDFMSKYNRYVEAVEDRNEKIKSHGEKLKKAKMAVEEATDVDYTEEDIKKIEELTSELRELRYDLKDAIKSKESNLKSVNSEMKALSELNYELDDLKSGTCPYCKQSHTDKEKIADVEKKVEGVTESIKKQEKEIEECDKDIEAINLEISELEEKIKSTPDPEEIRKQLKRVEDVNREYESLKKEGARTEVYDNTIEEFEKEYSDAMEESEEAGEELVSFVCSPIDSDNDSIRQRIESIKQQKRQVLSDIENAENELEFDSRNDATEAKYEVENAKVALQKHRASNKNPHDDELTTMKNMFQDLDTLMDDLDELHKRAKHCDYLIKLLTDPKSYVRKNIIDQYVPFLNKKLNEYSVAIGLPHVSRINSDLTVDITHMGRKTKFWNLSQGERLRINIATSLAFRDLMISLGKNCNILFFDELIDSAVDISGGRRILKLVMNKSDNFFFISHREEFAEHMDKKLLVTKENGFASLEIL